MKFQVVVIVVMHDACPVLLFMLLEESLRKI